jgi:O-antigen ligase
LTVGVHYFLSWIYAVIEHVNLPNEGGLRLYRFDRSSLILAADWLAVVVALVLPWSTSAVGIAVALWLVVLLPTLDATSLKRELGTGAGGFPVVLWCLGAVGMLWADVDWHYRFAGLDSFHRLLAVPLLLAQFRRSASAIWAIRGFFISSIILLVTSYAIAFAFGHEWRGVYGVPVHDAIFQSSVFLICGLGAIGYAALTQGKLTRRSLIAIFAIGALFLTNFAIVTTSRAALVIAPLLLVLLGWRWLHWRGAAAAVLLTAVAGGAMWFASSLLRDRIDKSIVEVQQYRAADKATSIGEHIAFLKGSLPIMASAPIIGHGTGSIAEEFQRITAGKTGVSAMPTVNPHSQTFAVAIQLGVLGALALWAMWIALIALFSGPSAVAWLGLVVVAENILSSTVHSHLFDFNSGWLYVFGVGVLGGTILHERDSASKKTEFS